MLTFVTLYLFIGLCFTLFLFTVSRDKIDISISMTAETPEQHKGILIAMIFLFIFGWPILIAQSKDN